MSLNIMIVEDQPYVAEATKLLLGGDPSIGTIETFTTADEAKEAIAQDRARWGLILLDLIVPGAVGMSLAAHIRDCGLASITCILTGTYKEEYVAAARRDGFRGYILKAATTQAVIEGLRAILSGQRVFPPKEATSDAVETVMLTPRQQAVMAMVGKGLTSKEIAKALNLTPGTVDNHIQASIFALGAKNRAEAAMKALALALITLD
ncbi:LuxR C-terminal-related transcriptional regulator [Variovorax sp. LARHSF232]